MQLTKNKKRLDIEYRNIACNTKILRKVKKKYQQKRNFNHL